MKTSYKGGGREERLKKKRNQNRIISYKLINKVAWDAGKTHVLLLA